MYLQRYLAAAAVLAAVATTAASATAASGPTAAIANRTLAVSGTNAPESIALHLTADPSALEVDVDGASIGTFQRADFDAIAVDAKGGDDTVRIDEGFGLFTPTTPTTLAGGNGDDTLIGGSGAEILDGGAGKDTVDGNRGNDTALLGAGDDTFTWDPGDGSDVVEGQAGRDTLQFNGSNAAEKIDLSANGSRLRFTRDVAGITMDTAGVETVDVSALGSADTIAVHDLAGTDVQTVNADLGAFDGTDDGAADVVAVDGTAGADDVSVASVPGRTTVKGLSTVVNVAHGAPTDTFAVEGLGGDDRFTSDTTSAAQLGVAFDGGEGTDTTNARGTAGDDSIGIARGADGVAVFSPGGNAVSVQTENLEVDALAGDDTVAGQNGIAGLTALTVDGGAGNDVIGGGDGADILGGGPGDDVVDGNRGNDTALLGAGDDTFTWDPGDGSDVVEGQAGRDTLQFNGSNAAEKIDLSANGSRLRLTRDVAGITMDTAGVENVNVSALGSADTVTVNDLRGTDVKAVNVDLGAFDGSSDGAADNVVVNGTTGRDAVRIAGSAGSATVTGLAATVGVTHADATTDMLTFNGLGGDDKVDSSGLAADAIGLIVD